MRLRAFTPVMAAVAIFINPLLINPAVAITQECPVFDFKTLFIADYSTGSKWDNSGGTLQITWSAKAARIYDENTVRPFTDREITWIRTAFKSWDSALHTVSFREVDPMQSPQISIGFVALKPSDVQLNAMGYWNVWVKNSLRYQATIKLKASETEWFSNKSHFIHSVQHELGNTLGLGDLSPSEAFVSVLEDPWQPPYGKSALSGMDVAMIRHLYGETYCLVNTQSKD